MPMTQELEIIIDGQPQRVPAGITVAAALARSGCTASRTSRSGMQRAAFCGMGVCHECRVTIDGQAHQRACMCWVSAGMQIVTQVQS